MPQKMITATAHGGALPRRINSVEIIISRFSWPGCEPYRFMPVSTEQKIQITCERKPGILPSVSDSNPVFFYIKPFFSFIVS